MQFITSDLPKIKEGMASLVFIGGIVCNFSCNDEQSQQLPLQARRKSDLF